MSNVVQMAVDDPATTVAHTASIGTLAATAMGYLPIVLALIPALYYLILIYESKTVQHWIAGRKMRKAALRIAVADAKKMVAEAEFVAANKLKEATKKAPSPPAAH